MSARMRMLQSMRGAIALEKPASRSAAAPKPAAGAKAESFRAIFESAPAKLASRQPAAAAPPTSAPQNAVPTRLAASEKADSFRAVVANPQPAAAQPAAAAPPTPAPPSATIAPTPASIAQQQIAVAIMGGYYAGSNNSNFSYATGVAQGGSQKTDKAAANLSDLQDTFYASIHQGDVANAHLAIDQMNSVRSSIGLNAFWSPVTDFQILQNAGGQLGEAARAFAEANPGVKDLNQFVNAGPVLLTNAGNGKLALYPGLAVAPSGGKTT
jgi:hypothetical protein